MSLPKQAVEGGGSGVAFATVVFLAVAGALCVSVFSGLNSSSLWFDELFTMWIVDDGHGFGETWRRALTDTHPPVYTLLLAGWTAVFSSSQAALRAFSALCAVAAVGIFLLGARRSFSLPGRACAAAFAVSTEFWFYQAHNARNYTLGLALAAALLCLGLAAQRALTAERRSQARIQALLFVVSALGVFTHYYLLFAVLCVYGALFIWANNHWQRAAFGLAATVLFIAGFSYLELVPSRFSGWDMENSWMRADPTFLVNAGKEAVRLTLNYAWAFGLAVLLIVALWVLVRRRLGLGSWLEARARFGALFLCLAVVGGVLALGLVSSLLLSPNFVARNFLLVSPFLWGALAWTFDYAFYPLQTRGRYLMAGVLALVSLSGLGLLAHRTSHNNPEFRASAEFVNRLPGCRDAAIPVLYTPRGGHPGYFERLYPFAYSHYLAAPRRVRLVDIDQLAAQPRPAKGGCRVVAWSAHNILGMTDEEVRAAVISASGGDSSVQIVEFPHSSAIYSGSKPVFSAFVALAPSPD